MKKVLIAAVVLLMTAVSFGQKKELKKAEKAIKAGDYPTALTQLSAAEALISSADDAVKKKFYATKALALTKSVNNDFEKMKVAALAYEKAIEVKGEVTPDLIDGITELRTSLINSAVQDQKSDKNKIAAEKLFTSFSITKRDTSDLYFAASSSVNGKDYPNALKYYKMLLDMRYTGITTSYVATEKETGSTQTFSTKNERDLMVRTGQFINPKIEKQESRRGEILRNMTLIYLDLDQQDEAKALIAKARAENPNDTSLMRAEANMAYKLNDFVEYNRIMTQVVATDPTNPELYFNLGVGAANSDQTDEALVYYEKALELKPDYRKVLINYGILKLNSEKSIVEEMNGLGTSRADNVRYDELKGKRDAVYTDAIPYLEKALKTGSDQENLEIMKTLASIYSTLGEDAKYKALKAKIDGM